MAGPVKTVCFIASVVIAWGLFVIGEAIVAWFDYKINGTEIPWNLEIVGHPLSSISSHPDKVDYINSILIHVLFLTGKSLSEALLFAVHGENMLCTKNVLNVRNNFCKYTTCSPQV